MSQDDIELLKPEFFIKIFGNELYTLIWDNENLSWTIKKRIFS